MFLTHISYDCTVLIFQRCMKMTRRLSVWKVYGRATICQWKVYQRGVFSAKNSILIGNGSDLGAEPHRIEFFFLFFFFCTWATLRA